MLEEPTALENLFRKAQDASLESFALYRIIRDEAGAFADLEVLYGNPAAHESGIVPCAPVGKRLLTQQPALQASPVWATYRQVADTGQPLRTESAREGRAGCEVWFATTVVKVDDACLMIFARDITEHQRSAEKLRRSEEALNRAQQIAHLGSWDWNLIRNDFVCSPELFAIFGITPEQNVLDPDSFIDFVHSDDRERLRSVVNETKRRGGAFHLEYRVARPDGSERNVLSQGEITVEAGRAVRVVGTVLDITDRKQAERGRDESLHWLRAVLAQTPVGMMLVHGPDGSRIEVNEHLQRLTGGRFTGDGKCPELILTPDAAPLAGDELPSVRALRGEELRLVEYLVRNELGDLIPVLASATPIRDDRGQVQGAVVAFQDITPVKELERMRAEWNTIIAHDLRQPLNTISLSTGILLREAGEAPNIRRPIDWIMRATKRLTGMIEELFDLSRMEARQLALAPKPIDLLALVHASVEAMALEASGRRFEVCAHGALVPIAADGDRIAQVLENLLTNAVKYSFADTAVVIGVTSVPGYLAVEVTNSGPGISADELPLLFQRFRRTDSARRSTVYGIGLGLYIARQLVEAHGGSLTAESSPGSTTTFRFLLPVP